MNKLLSIIIPCFNVEDYIIKCLASISSLNLDSVLEIIIIDDGSTDFTLKYIKRWKAENNNLDIYIIQQDNGGQSVARNKGLEKSVGSYVWFIDGDDFIIPDDVAKALHKATTNNLDILWFDHDLVDDNYELLPKPIEDIKVNIDENINSGNFYLKNGFKFSCMPVMFFFRKEFIKFNDIKFTPNIYFEDILFTTECIDKAQRMSFYDKSMYRYLIRYKGSTMRDPAKAEKRIKDALYVSSELKKMSITMNNPNYFKTFSTAIAVYKLKEVAKMDVKFISIIKSYIKDLKLLPLPVMGSFNAKILSICLNSNYNFFNIIFKKL